MTNSERSPRLCFVGPLLGRNEGWVLSQGEILAELFTKEGYPVRITSRKLQRALRLVDILASLIKWRKTYDIVNMAVFSGPGFIPVDVVSILTKVLHKPLIMVLRGGNLPQFSTLYPNWIRRVLSRSDALVAPSYYLSHFYQSWGFKVKMIPNVLALEAYPFRHRPRLQPNLLWMRTFHEAYNPFMAVEVLSRLLRVFPDACLTMAGQEKGLLGLVKDLALRIGVDNHMRFVGFLDLAGKQREFPNHDIFLNTNHIDNMPVSVVEAAAFGLPVVATLVGGIPYLLQHEETALLVDDGDINGMAQAIERLLKEPKLAAHLSAKGRLLAESCAWPVVRDQWEKLFEELL